MMMRSPLLQIIKYQLHDMLRSRWLLIYTLVFFGITDSLFRFGADPERVALSLMNVVLFIIPLVSLIFGTLFYYNSREFIELLLAQPIKRPILFMGLYIGLNISLLLPFLVGTLLPPLYHVGGYGSALLSLLFVGVLLTLCSTALAFLLGVYNEQRVLGIGFAFVTWLVLTFVYDGLILILLLIFESYPLDRFALVASMLNPVDLGRILLMMQFDIAALMGYTGAIFQRFFGTPVGTSTAFLLLLLWTMGPYTLGIRAFRKKDF